MQRVDKWGESFFCSLPRLMFLIYHYNDIDMPEYKYSFFLCNKKPPKNHIFSGFTGMGLSEINSKNYKIILDKVKCAPLTPVKDNSSTVHPDNANNIKTEIKQQQKYLSDEEISEIVIKYKCGKSTYELAEEYGCHRYTISKHLKEAGIEVTNRVARKESLVGLILQLYSEWYKPAEIGEALGISADSVRRCLKENGIELRHSSAYAQR
ncbi:MAG: hypothetical protein Q4F98_07650 [Lachnospiraceae bacterium]|nr:hypothetical protein [Lachnospiraceae bacterium]